MSTAQPIRDLTELENFKNYYLEIHPNIRNYTLITAGINTALRISDILSLHWEQVYDFRNKRFHKYIHITEQKTGKETRIAINQNLQNAFCQYLNSLNHPKPDDYIFWGKTPKRPLSRSQAFRIIKNVSIEQHMSESISCHSLRKTFGYHAWNSGASPVVLMLIYNHSSFEITKRYLGIEQEDKDAVFMNTNL